jgi:hypothetical protein
MRRNAILTLACAMLAALAIMTSTAAAQTATGQITGTVRDASGAVMSGVKVVVTNNRIEWRLCGAAPARRRVSRDR